MCEGKKEGCGLCARQGLIELREVTVLPQGKVPEIRECSGKKQEVVIVVKTG